MEAGACARASELLRPTTITKLQSGCAAPVMYHLRPLTTYWSRRARSGVDVGRIRRCLIGLGQRERRLRPAFEQRPQPPPFLLRRRALLEQDHVRHVRRLAVEHLRAPGQPAHDLAQRARTRRFDRRVRARRPARSGSARFHSPVARAVARSAGMNGAGSALHDDGIVPFAMPRQDLRLENALHDFVKFPSRSAFGRSPTRSPCWRRRRRNRSTSALSARCRGPAVDGDGPASTR